MRGRIEDNGRNENWDRDRDRGRDSDRECVNRSDRGLHTPVVCKRDSVARHLREAARALSRWSQTCSRAWDLNRVTVYGIDVRVDAKFRALGI
jgi:hypothetical protein